MRSLGADVWAAYDYTIKAAEKIDVAADVLCPHPAGRHKQPAGLVVQILGRELGL